MKAVVGRGKEPRAGTERRASAKTNARNITKPTLDALFGISLGESE
jgi:hypothetical protein